MTNIVERRKKEIYITKTKKKYERYRKEREKEREKNKKKQYRVRIKIDGEKWSTARSKDRKLERREGLHV